MTNEAGFNMKYWDAPYICDVDKCQPSCLFVVIKIVYTSVVDIQISRIYSENYFVILLASKS